MAGIYIHVPFCKKRCVYCDFYSNTQLHTIDQFVSAVCLEIQLRKEFITPNQVETIYFGGGTPSVLQEQHFEQIFSALSANFKLSEKAEITIEVNPDDIDLDYLQSLQRLPFNRISMGVQSFHDDELTFLGRRHSAKEAIKVVDDFSKFGFDNVSIDLMYGLPNQTLDRWKQNLSIASRLPVTHLSAYHLIYEEGTALHRQYINHQIHPVSEELSTRMFDVLIDNLSQAGFEHYEISNFAKTGFISKHNSSYWLGKPYLGLGPSAHSFDGNCRFHNPPVISQYLDRVGQGETVALREEATLNSRYNDYVLTRLRTKWGLNLNEVEKLFGAQRRAYCFSNAQKYIQQGLLQLHSESCILTLTRQGIFVSDMIMSDMMFVD